MTEQPTLTETERIIIGLERQVWQYVGTKEQVVREKLDVSLTRYYQMLNAMLDDQRVEAAAPIDIRRLQRVRDARQLSRAGRRLDFG